MKPMAVHDQEFFVIKSKWETPLRMLSKMETVARVSKKMILVERRKMRFLENVEKEQVMT